MDIRVLSLETEQCPANKEKYDIIVSVTAIHYILDGFGYFNGIKLGKGQFFCTLEGCHASWYPDRETPWTYCYVRFEGKDILPLFEEYGITDMTPYGNFAFFDELDLLCKLYFLQAAKAAENDAFMESLGNLFLSLHKKNVETESTQSAIALHVKQIKQYIDINYYKKLSIEEIAKDSFLSRQYIRNIFQANIGFSPKKYLKKVRMEKAAELLTGTNYKIALIAKSVGYEDQLQFSKAFHSTFGVSPSEYRSASRINTETQQN